MADELNWLSAREMTRRFAGGDLSPVDVLDATLAQLTRQPAASVPCGFVEGLPIGLQIVGPIRPDVSRRNHLRASRCVEQACATGVRPALTL